MSPSVRRRDAASSGKIGTLFIYVNLFYARVIICAGQRAGHPISVDGVKLAIDNMAIMAIFDYRVMGWRMKALSAREAKYNFGRLIDTARAEPVVIEKHGRPVVVVLAVEEYEKLIGTQATGTQAPHRKTAAAADKRRVD